MPLDLSLEQKHSYPLAEKRTTMPICLWVLTRRIYIVNLCKFLQIIFPCPNIRICPQLSLTVANQEWFIVALFSTWRVTLWVHKFAEIRVHFMFRLTTPRKFFKVIYALDTHYSVVGKRKSPSVVKSGNLPTRQKTLRIWYLIMPI